MRSMLRRPHLLRLRTCTNSTNSDFLIYLLLCSGLAIFFLLYFNRVVASAVSYAIRTYTWHKHRIYIDIQALQISLLGGRIFFTGLRYHGSNETFFIQHGYITWRYWLRRVREVDILIQESSPDTTESAHEKNEKLPCRVTVNLIGVEWFVYNRSPAYNSIIAGLSGSLTPDIATSTSASPSDGTDRTSPRLRKAPPDNATEKSGESSTPRNDSHMPNGHDLSEKTRSEPDGPGPRSRAASNTTRSESFVEGEETYKSARDLPFLLQFFPIRVKCEKAAAVIGNDNTKGVLVVRADSLGADIDASKTQTVDPYRQVFKVQFDHPVVQLRENEDFKMDQTARATGEGLANLESQPPPKPNFARRWALKLGKLFRRLRRRLFGARRVRFPDPQDPLNENPSQIPGANNWQGLSRYLDDQDLDDKARWASIEYAAEPTILDSPDATLVVYWDVVSKITTHARRHPEPGPSNRINGSSPPAWGMHFIIKGGIMNYGPWADRRRADLQRVFFPTMSKDAVPATPLPAGAWRVPTEFTLNIDLEETVAVRVPFREPSKNWRWRGQEPQLKQQKSRSRRDRTKKDTKGEAAPVRPSAWLEAKLAANSTISYSMDMLASSKGYKNKLDIELTSTEIRTAVNQDLLWKSGVQHISCDLSNPLTWNSLRQWRFDVQSDDLELYLLRDHIFLLIDLIDDWSSGPPPEYLVFTPFKYLMNLNLRNLRLNLNVNDANIIDNATAMDENAYLIISSPLLTAQTAIPIDKYRPDKNAIPFNVQAETLDLAFNAPQWNTLSAFALSDEIGRVKHLDVGGKYHYNATTSPANTDTLVLNVHGQSAQAFLHGFVVRFFLLLKDNYFGDHVHFRTLDEYQEHLQLKDQGQDAQPTRAPNKKSNDLDVILAIKLENPKVMIPTNLYSSTNYVEAELASVSVDLRFTNYYMDMELALSPLSLSLGSLQEGLDSPNFQSNTQLFINGVRVYGHRLFGLPPTEPTYLCNWDVSVGAISGQCSGAFLAALARGGASFGFTFDDVENALIPYSSLVFDDVTFARVRVEGVRVWLHVDEAAFLFSTDAIDVTFDDWANAHYSKKANISVPNVELSCINSESAARYKSRHQHPTETHAYFRTDLRIASIGRKLHFSEKRKLQQELVQREDQRTNRTPFLLRPEFLDHLIAEQIDPPAQCSPVPPHPIPPPESETNSLRSSTPSRRSRALRHQSSFLSLSASSTHSVQRSRSRHTTGNGHERKLDSQLGPPSSYDPSTRAAFPDRTASASSRRDSALYHDTSRASVSHDHHHHTSVAFSSPYYTPHFALDGVQPTTRELPLQDFDEENEGDFLSNTVAELDDVDPDCFSQDHSYNSLLLEFPNGLTGFLHPTAVKHTTSLIAALQPTDPEEIIDSLQTSAMGKVFGSKKKGDAKGTTMDVLLRLPKASVRFLHSSSLDSPDPLQEEQDQYDLLISNVGLVTRSVSDFVESNPEANEARTSLHLSVGSAEVSASERLSSVPQPQAAMMVQVEDIIVSVGAKEVTYIDAEVGSILGSTASGKVEYLASLIHRTATLARELENLVGATITRHDNRLRYFMYRLLEEGHSTSDPSFIVRPSAVLRSAPSHLRTYDSWKLVMRLRQIWSTMDHARKTQMIDDLWSHTVGVPPDAAELVIAAFERWRNWDLESVPGSVLVQNVYGALVQDGKHTKVSPPLRGACRLAELQLVLDPGPKENKIGLVDISARIDKQDKLSEKGVSESLTILTILCENAGVNLNWELCELVEDILRLYNQARAEGRLPDPRRKKAAPAALVRAANTLHVVVEVARSSLEAEAVNLHVKSQCRGFKTSILSNSGGTDSKAASIIFKCDMVKSELSSHSDLLAYVQLREPSVFLAHELSDGVGQTALQSIKATASSQDLQVVVKQDPIGLMEVLELLLQDEVAQLLHLKQQMPVSSQPQEPVGMAERLSNFRFNIVMFLDQYSINVALLQSLSYKISGVVARAACTSQYGHDITFDFDIKENSHETQIDVKNEPRRISLMQIPPTNGRITHEMGGSEHILTVLCSVELMELDASAVYSLLAALNRPQVSSAIDDMKGHSKIIQRRISDTFGSQEDQGPKPSSENDDSKSNLVYHVHLTLAGLQVSALTPLNSPTEPISQLLFFLDKVHLQASNRPTASSGPPAKYPEVHFNIKQIGVDIRRGQRDMMRSCGSFGAGITVSASSQCDAEGKDNWTLDFRSPDLVINLSPETVSTAVGVLGYLRDKIKDLDTSRELNYLKKLRQSKPRIMIDDREVEGDDDDTDILDSVLGVLGYHFELQNIMVCWIVANEEGIGGQSKIKEEDLVLSIKLIQFGNRTKKSARLTIKDFQLQTVPPGHDKTVRSVHSALLPEVIFNIAFVSTPTARRMAFQAVGQSLDLRITSGFIVPAANLADSISLSAKNVQDAYAGWDTSTNDAPERTDETAVPAVERPWNLSGKRRLESLLIDADFAGATVHISSKRNFTEASRTSKGHRPSLAGKYGQFNADDTGSGAVLESPGLAWKVEFRDDGHHDPNLSGEIKINASKNTLYPSVVPLIMEILSSVKEVVSDDADDLKKEKEAEPPPLKPEKSGEEENILTADPSAVLGRLRLDLGLRICRQDFSLSCQPIAQVAAMMCFDSIYFTANTVTSPEQGNFFAISGTFTSLQASVQHVYSRESTASFDIETITLSFMNSKHVSGTSGVSAILNVSPMRLAINAKQVQDFLLFREIWYPEELRRSNKPQVAKLVTETSQGHLVQKYQQVAATAAFPWTATISIAALDVNVDLGQAIGKSVFEITDFWVSSKKTSDWEQNLCLGFKKIGVDCTGRLSGFVTLQDFKLRTSIQWPKREEALNGTPLVQASLGFHALRLKAAFDYQAFLIADITSLEFLMYNVRHTNPRRGDRLVAILDGEAVQVFGTTTSTSQAVALYQAVKKLIQERRGNFEASLKEIEKFMKRKSSSTRYTSQPSDLETPKSPEEEQLAKSPISLDTDVVVTLKALNMGVFPSTFYDHQVFKMEALNAFARFAASIESGQIHSLLKMTLGQLRIGLAGVRSTEAPKALSEISVQDVVQRATGSRGGTILKVPQVSAVMETWQKPESKMIDYIFKSAFQGKVEVGWNYSRISFIRGMWANHTKALEQTWGRELPMAAAVKITGVPEGEGGERRDGEQQKITAEVNVPQSKYNYQALEPAIIETPQLRDMGEATPPLEWIGLHRDKLPNLTHQIVIVSLLELAGEVEDAYSRILGVS